MDKVREGGGDTDPENDSDYKVKEYDTDFYEIELEKSDSGEEEEMHDGDVEDELVADLEKSSSRLEVSYFTTSEDETMEMGEEWNKALGCSELTSSFDITELHGSSKEDYFKIVGENSLMDDDYGDDIKQGFVMKKKLHRKIDISEKQKEKDSKNDQLIQQKEEQIRQEQKQRAEQLLREQRIREEKSKEKKLQEQERLKHEQLRLEEEKLKEQLRQEKLRQERESQKLLQENQLQREEQSRVKKERQLQTNGQNLLQQRPFPSLHSSSPQRSINENIFKSEIKPLNDPTTPTTPSLSMKSFHLPDISLSQQSGDREFRRMSNILGNSDKGPVAALRTLTDNYRQLELDKQNADKKVCQLEKQLEQYRQLLRKEQTNSKINNNYNELETISGGVEGDTKTLTLSEKEKIGPSIVSLQKKYKVIKRQLEYMKICTRKAEDERDEAKKALIKTQQDIMQMNDQFESIRASAQMPNQSNTQTFNVAVPTQPLPAKPLLSEQAIELSNIDRSKDNINFQENKQMFEPKENIRDSGSERSKSREKVDPEQIKIQEEIENSRIARENERKQRLAMEKTRRKKATLETSREDNENFEESEDWRPTNKLGGPQHFVISNKEVLQDQHEFKKSYEYSNKYKQPMSHMSRNERYFDPFEQQYDEETYDDSKALNKRTDNKIGFPQVTNRNEEQRYYEHYEDEPRDNLQFGNNRGLLNSSNKHYFDTRKDRVFEREGSFPLLQRQFFDNREEDSDTHSSDLRQSPTRDTRDGRIYSQYSNESQDNVYTHIRGRRQNIHRDYTYDSSEKSDHIVDRDYLNRGERSTSLTSLQQDYPIWKDVKNSKSYLRKRNYGVQEPVPPKPSLTRPGSIGREIPFILGTGTGKSHSVTVNLQKAFKLLKNHNPNSCSVCNKKNTNIKKQAEVKTTRSRSEKNDESPDVALGRVIGNLADELKHLKMHYSNLVEEYQKIGPLDSKSKRTALTEEMKELMDQMEMKGDQIATLHDIQQKTIKSSLPSRSRYGLKLTAQNNSRKPTRPIHETRAESLNLLRGTQRVQKTLNGL